MNPKRFESAHDRRQAILFGEDTFRALRVKLNALTSPTPDEFILLKLEVLRSRYAQLQPLPPAILKEIEREWLDDLKIYPAHLIDKACQNWRHSDNEFAPRSAGVLMKSVGKELTALRVQKTRCNHIIEILESEAA